MADLDPATTMARQAEQKAREAVAPVLEPPFPYDRIRFDAEYFSADREVDSKAVGT